jgi:2-C-methyl-D-erythritol 2,4-cyclodiphosphate synthase
VPSPRAGIGYDIHPFDETRPLFLGGIRIEGSPGLKGHSDADALLHAIIDSLLGAAGLGDIGQHFSPDDPAYKDMDSRELLGWTRELLYEKGRKVLNVDATVIAERPPLLSHLPAMERVIARVLEIDEERVNVKATTHEGLGAIGRGEGIAAMAIALIE